MLTRWRGLASFDRLSTAAPASSSTVYEVGASHVNDWRSAPDQPDEEIVLLALANNEHLAFDRLSGRSRAFSSVTRSPFT